MAPIEPGPTVRHRILAAHLRMLRADAGLTPENAANSFGWHRTKLVRIETAKVMPSVGDINVILEAYGGPDEAIKAGLIKLAREIRKRGWWAPYGDVLAGAYAELEDAANRIRSWQVQLVPGLLQTEDYARELIQNAVSDPSEIDLRLQVRMTRKTMLSRQEPPHFEALLAEEVLLRPVGGPKVMRGQLRALLDTGERSNVSIRVIPMTAGLYQAIGQGSMVLFEFAGPMDLSVAYLETLAGGMYVEDIAQVRRCNVTYNRIADAALSAEESAALIAALVEESPIQ